MVLWVKIYILSTQLLHTKKLRSLEHVCPSNFSNLDGPRLQAHHPGVM